VRVPWRRSEKRVDRKEYLSLLRGLRKRWLSQLYRKRIREEVSGEGMERGKVLAAGFLCLLKGEGGFLKILPSS